MKILELRQSLRHGNLERLIVSTAALLSARGMETDVLLLNNRSRARLLGEDETTLPDVHPLIVEADRLGVMAWQEIDRSPLSVHLLFTILRLIRQRHYGLLHTHDFKTNVLGILAGRLAGIPVIATAHGYPRAVRRNDVYRRLDLLALRLCQRVICVSESLRQELLSAGLDGRRLTVIHNGIAVAEIARSAAAGPHTLRRDLGMPPDASVIMAVGRLSAEKGHACLLRAFAVAGAERSDLRLVIVGDGPLRAVLECLAAELGIRERVFFLGFRADVPALMAQCDILVNPSLGEALGNVVLEAMALGRPVIGAATGGMPEVICNGETGLIVPVANAEALAGAIQRLLNNPELAIGLGERGRDSVLACFTVERMADGLAAAFVCCSGASRCAGKLTRYTSPPA
jgi:glycosyltransferase involved in cell wall biosynthesis